MNSRTSGPSDINRDDEAILIERIRDGNEAAFETLVKRYQKRVFAVACGLLGDQTEAMDVVQDSFIRVFRGIGGFRGESGFYTWLYRIVVNLCFDRLRGRKHLQTESLTYPDDEGEDSGEERHEADSVSNPDRILESSQLKDDIRAALMKLSADHRAVIILREVEGLSYGEIAQTMNCSMGTVMSRLFYARKRLQEMLKEHY